MRKIKQKIIVGIFIGFALSMTVQAEARGGFAKSIVKYVSKAIGKPNRIRHKKGVSSSYSGRILSKHVLRQCINMRSRINDNADNLDVESTDVDSEYVTVSIVLKSYQKDIEDMSQDINQLKKNIDGKDVIISSYKKDIDILDSKIQREESRVNLYDDQSVNNYNALIYQRQSIADIYNKLIDERNIPVEQRAIIIESHNTLVDKSEKLSDEYNVNVFDYNKGLASHNSNIDNYNQTCSHAYYEKDMKDILAESDDEVHNP